MSTSKVTPSKKDAQSTQGELRDAMDKVMARITLEDIATAAGYSVNALKQARLDPSASGYRTPPPGLRRVLYELCRRQAKYFLALARQLRPSKE